MQYYRKMGYDTWVRQHRQTFKRGMLFGVFLSGAVVAIVNIAISL